MNDEVEKARDELMRQFIRLMELKGRTGPSEVCFAIEHFVDTKIREAMTKPNGHPITCRCLNCYGTESVLENRR